MSMVTLSWIIHTIYLLWEPQQNITNQDLTEAAPLDQVQETTMKTGTGEVILDHSLIFTDIGAQVVMTHTEAAPGNNVGIITATPGVPHNAHAPHIEMAVIDPATTHHTNLTADHPHIEVPQLTTQGEICKGHTHTPADHEANHTSRRTQE